MAANAQYVMEEAIAVGLEHDIVFANQSYSVS